MIFRRMSDQGNQSNGFNSQFSNGVEKTEVNNHDASQKVSIYSRAAEEFFRLDLELQILLDLPNEVSVSQTVNTALCESVAMLNLTN
jgi:hypothetical protein